MKHAHIQGYLGGTRPCPPPPSGRQKGRLKGKIKGRKEGGRERKGMTKGRKKGGGGQKRDKELKELRRVSGVRKNPPPPSPP